MSNTITEYEYLGTDTMKQGIADVLAVESELLRVLPFMTIMGNSYKYNYLTTRSSNQWVQPGATITESTPVWEQRSTDLTILIGDADVDQFAQATNNQHNCKASVIAQKARDIAYDFEIAAIMGTTTTNADADETKGLMLLTAECESKTATDWDAPNNDQLIVGAASASAALSLDLLDEMIDLIRGKPEVLFMNKRMRRKLTSLARAAGSNLEHDRDQLGFLTTNYGEARIILNDYIPDNLTDPSSSVVTLTSYDPTTTSAAGYDTSAIWAAKLGDDGLSGVMNGGLQTEEVGIVQNKDALRTRIKWYCGLANFHKLSLACITGLTN